LGWDRTLFRPSRRHCETSRLDDRVLRDIGIDRSQIEAAVCGLINPSE